MHTAGFVFGVVPILGLFYLFCMVLARIPIREFDDICMYIFAGFACQMVIMGFRVWWVARKSHLHFSRAHKKLPETASTRIDDKFGVHIVEETLKFIILAVFAVFLAQNQLLVASYVLIVSGVFAGNKLGCQMVTFSPVNYKRHYAKFISAFEKFETRACVLSDKISLNSDDAISQLSEPHTLVLKHSDEPGNALFKLDVFNPQAETQTGVPIPGSPDILTAQLRSIERLYSVSPKDTMYFAYEHFRDTHELDPFGQSIKSENCFETSSARSGGPSLEFKEPENTHKHHVRPQAYLNIEDYSKQNNNYTPSWWAWLFPWCNTKEQESIVPRKRERALLRKKLSNFTLNSDTLSVEEKRQDFYGESETSSLKSACSYKLYGTLELESQQVHTVANSHTYYEFSRYANKFLDFWSPSLRGVLRCIDPAFMRFGAPIPSISSIYFVLYGASACLWQVSSTLLLALPLLVPDFLFVLCIFTFIILMPVKFFCNNYLHGQCGLSYKVSILLEFVLNSGLFAVVYPCFYYLASI